MSENNERPEWASGPEWDGWEPTKFMGKTMQAVLRCTKHSHPVVIRRAPWNDYWHVDGAPVYKVEAALVIANIIAEDRGGWA